MDRPPVHELSAVNGHSLRFKYRSTTGDLPPGQKPPSNIGKMVESNLEKASGILDKVEAVAKKCAEFAANVGEFALKFGPLVLGARHLFGLP